MNKRFLSGLLCLCLLLGSFAVSAFADTLIVDNIAATDGDGYAAFDDNISYTQEIDINAQAYDNPDGVKDIDAYKVEIVWGDMAFAWGYTDALTKEWNPVDHSYTVVDDRTDKEWWLIDDTTPLSLPSDTDGSYSQVAAGTRQNYVVMFNHSSKPVNANVSIKDVNAGAADDNITAEIMPDDSFGTTGVLASDGLSYDYALDYDRVTETDTPGSLYSLTNGTAAAAYVQLSGEPTDGALNETDNTTVATVTVQLSLPENA